MSSTWALPASLHRPRRRVPSSPTLDCTPGRRRASPDPPDGAPPLAARPPTRGCIARPPRLRPARRPPHARRGRRRLQPARCRPRRAPRCACTSTCPRWVPGVRASFASPGSPSHGARCALQLLQCCSRRKFAAGRGWCERVLKTDPNHETARALLPLLEAAAAALAPRDRPHQHRQHLRELRAQFVPAATAATAAATSIVSAPH